jgi:hypothetical protein
MLVGRDNEYAPGADEPTYWIEFLWKGVRINTRLFDHFRVCRDFSELEARAQAAHDQPSFRKPEGILDNDIPCCWRAQFRHDDQWLEMEAGWRYELPAEDDAGEWTIVPREYVYARLEQQMRKAHDVVAEASHREEMRKLEERKAKMTRHPSGFYYPAK